MRTDFHPLVVEHVEPLTDDSAAITFAGPDDLVGAFAFAAGQSLTIRRGELPPAFLGDPVTAPRRSQLRSYRDASETGALEAPPHVRADFAHRRAAGVGRRDHRGDRPAVLLHVAEDAEVRDGEHRKFRIQNGRGGLPAGHHVASG